MRYSTTVSGNSQYQLARVSGSYTLRVPADHYFTNVDQGLSRSRSTGISFNSLTECSDEPVAESF